MRAYDGNMISLKGSLFRPTGFTLLTLLVIVPVQYFLAVDSRCRMGSIQWQRHSPADQEVSNRLHRWLFDQLDYSRGFKNRHENRIFEFANASVKEQFESEFWPDHFRAQSAGIIASPVCTDAKKLTNNIWRIRSSISFFSVQGKEAKAGDSLIFEVDMNSSPFKILNYKHEDPNCAEFLADSNDSTCSKYSNLAVGCFKRGINFDLNKQPAEAVKELSNALKIEPKFKNAAIIRAQISTFSSKPEKGERILTETIALSPDRLSLYRARACLRMDQGKFEDALLDMNYAIEHESSTGYAFVNRGYCYSQLGRHKEALADLEIALKLEPKESSFHFYRGLARQASGDAFGAFFDFLEVKQNCKGYFFDEKGRPMAYPYVMFSP